VVWFQKDKNGLSLIPNLHGIYIWIQIPKPTSVRFVRPIAKVASDLKKPFFCGDTDPFGINPDTLPGFYVLSYDYVMGDPRLYGESRSATGPMRFSGGGMVQNLHLYAEPPYVPGDDTAHDHVELFNGMFNYNGNKLNVRRDCQTAQTCGTANGALADLWKTHVPDDLTRLDLATLAELHVDSAHTPCPPRAQPVTPRPDRKPQGTYCPRVVDPAGCIDGWVDGDDSP
jgi:hypothetical protein